MSNNDPNTITGVNRETPASVELADVTTIEEMIARSIDPLTDIIKQNDDMIMSVIESIINALGERIATLELDVLRERDYVDAVLLAHGIKMTDGREEFAKEWNRINYEAMREALDKFKGSELEDVE